MGTGKQRCREVKWKIYDFGVYILDKNREKM